MKRIIKDMNKLRVPAEPLKFITETGIIKEEGEEIISKIKEVMEHDKNIIALTAPQIGINKRVFCIRFEDKIKTFINPIVTKKEGCVIAPEIFLSTPGKEYLLARPKELTTVYYTDDFKYDDNKLIGAASRIYDQCTQILDGVLPEDIGLVSDVETDGSLFDASDEEMKEYIDMYKKFISIKSKSLDDSISADKDESEAYRKLKFTEDVVNGRTKVLENPNDAAVNKMNRAERRSMKKLAKLLKRKKGSK